MNFEEYTRERISHVGRKKGGTVCNKMRSIYRTMRKDCTCNVDYKTFTAVVNAVGDEIWHRLYAGNIVAIPYLFNMEVVPNKFRWVNRINWKRTHELWEEDADAFNDKMLVRHEPTRYYLRVRHSTLSRKPGNWYRPLLFEIRPVKAMLKGLDDKYELR